MQCRCVLPQRVIRIVVLVALTVCALGAAAKSSDYLMDVWTSDDDLADSSVTAIAQTPDGYLWIGTLNGLARFDGVRFTTFDPANTPQLNHARVLGLFVDASGTLWVNTYGGWLTSYQNGVFTQEWQSGQVSGVFSKSNWTYFATLSNGLSVRTKTPSQTNKWQRLLLSQPNTASFFCQDADGVVWCLLRDGTIKWVQGTNVVSGPDRPNLEGERVNCLTADKSGRVWAGTTKKIACWNGKQFEDQTPTNGEPVANTSFLFCNSDNGCWAFVNDTVRQAVNREWKTTIDSWGDLLRGSALYVAAYEERGDGVWFRTYGQGLFHAGKDGKLERIYSGNGLPGDRVSCWLQDREGNLWVGVDRAGLVRLRKRQFEVIGSEDTQKFAVSTICEDLRGNMWLGTFGSGLNRWQNGELKRFDLPEGVNRSAFFSVCPDTQGRIWLSADHEDLFMLETNRISRGPDSLHGIKAMFTDSKGRLWIGRQYQLTCIDSGRAINYGTRNGFPRTDVRALAEDSHGVIWIGAGNGVLYKFDSGIFTAFKPDGNPDAQAIWSLLPDDDGTIWAGTFRGGLLRFKDGKFTRYTARSGLPGDVICQILQDDLGRLWFGSHKGIFFLSKEAFDAFDRGEIQTLPCTAYGLSDGLPSLECSGSYQPSAWRSRDGKLYFATVKGAVEVKPGEVQPNRVPPPVVLEEFLVDGKRSSTTDSIQIPPGKHHLDFQFTALSFTAPEKVRFRYRLEKFDNGWVEGGTHREAHYGPLQPGDYKFQVIACNNDGVWNELGAALVLKQMPFFWQTWWFEFGAAVVAFILISAWARYVATRHLARKLERLKQQRAIQHERERIAKDIHDDLGAGLTQIMLQSSLARRESPERMQTDLVQISDNARELVRAMDEIVWAVDPENDTLDELVTYLGKYAKDFLTAAKLRCRLDFPPFEQAIAVSAEARHNLFLAMKETLNNVVKHSHATEVSLHLKIQADSFTLLIRDNGTGFARAGIIKQGTEADRISSGHGLQNLNSRLEAIGGRCTIQSEPDKGTQVELTVPLKAQSHI